MRHTRRSHDHRRASCRNPNPTRHPTTPVLMLARDQSTMDDGEKNTPQAEQGVLFHPFASFSVHLPVRVGVGWKPELFFVVAQNRNKKMAFERLTSAWQMQNGRTSLSFRFQTCRHGSPQDEVPRIESRLLEVAPPSVDRIFAAPEFACARLVGSGDTGTECVGVFGRSAERSSNRWHHTPELQPAGYYECAYSFQSLRLASVDVGADDVVGLTETRSRRWMPGPKRVWVREVEFADGLRSSSLRHDTVGPRCRPRWSIFVSFCSPVDFFS